MFPKWLFGAVTVSYVGALLAFWFSYNGKLD